MDDWSMAILLRTDAELKMGDSWPDEARQAVRFLTAPDDQVGTIARLATEADLLFTCYAPITAEVLQAGKRLRGVVKYGVGVDSIDLETAGALGIPVVHCPAYGTETVADHAFALLISLARRLPQIDRGMLQTGWLWPATEFCGFDLAGKTLGIIGYGRIGKAMARRAGGFGMRRLICDPYVAHDIEANPELSFAPLQRVLEEADFLSLHCVLTDETRGIIDAQAFDRMKPTALLINVSRGALIDKQALIDALAADKIAGAGLDVFENEPLDRNEPLYQFPNVQLTPHLAFYTHEAYERLEAQCYTAVRSLLQGRLPGSPLFVKNHALLNLAALGERGIETEPTAPAALEQRSRHASPAASTTGPKNEQAPRNEQAPGNEDPRWKVAEGDVNTSPHRVAWQQHRVDERSQDWLQRDAAVFLHQSLSTPCLTALSACHGALLVDEAGRQYLDFHGNSAHQVGYRHPHVLEAVRRQMETLPFCPRRFTNQPAVELAERLARLAPGRLAKVLFAPGGTSAIGMAMKLARYATGRYKTISMWDTFHGASLDAISIGGEALFRDGLGPLLPGCFHVPWPKAEQDAQAIEQILHAEGDIGAIIAEPLRCTTFARPPDAYWRRVRELCDRHGALLVFDEIPLALGRTGRMFCCEHSGVVPDILVIGKGLGGGLFPMAAMLARDDLDVASDYAVGHYTHEKSPLGTAAALATLEVIQEEQLVERASELGAQTLQQLARLRLPPGLQAEARGIGLAMALELRRGGAPACDEAQRVLYACLSEGLSFKVSDGNVLTLTPPLTITHQEMNEALRILQHALQRLGD
jgi:4-aminobutyrate aminotransferase